MKNRYSETKIKINKNGKRVMESTLYPIIERKDTDIYIRSKRGDRLDLYALTYYGNTQYWVIIAMANQLGHGTLCVPGDIQIRIPMDTKTIKQYLKELNG